MTEPELWNIDQVAEHLGYEGPSANKSATGTLSRWGVKADGYERSPNGRPRALYPAAEIRAAKAARPGRGARTDLHANER